MYTSEIFKKNIYYIYGSTILLRINKQYLATNDAQLRDVFIDIMMCNIDYYTDFI